MLVVGRQDTILHMNASARHFFGERVKSLDRVIPEMPLKLNRLQEVLAETGTVSCVATELSSGIGRRHSHRRGVFP